MNNLSFLKKVLMSKDDYWIVAQKNHSREYGEWKRIKDTIYLIVVPATTRRGVAYENISLFDLERLRDAEVNNVCINECYPPFQKGITMYNIYDGYAIPEGVSIKSFMIQAIALGSDSIHDYKELLEPATISN